MRGARVLVVDDEPLSRDVLVRLLVSRGFEVESANDGPSCMEALEPGAPDLVLLDVSMPGMSGLDVLRCIRRTHAHDQLPVILVTALVDSDDVVAGLEAGANDYIVKPVNLPVLLARIAVSLRIKQGVERLVEAERMRVSLASLDEACGQLSGPMSVVIDHLTSLLGELPEEDEDMRPRLEEILAWANAVRALIERFQKIAGYRQDPYTEGLGSFVAASLESTRQRPRSDAGAGARPPAPGP